MGLPVGVELGSVEGAFDTSGVGAIVGEAVGNEVPPIMQVSLPVFTQRGEKLSNCCKVSKTDANPHSSPVLLFSKLSIFENAFPNTATLETPTMLLTKHVRCIVSGPKVSTTKLFVAD